MAVKPPPGSCPNCGATNEPEAARCTSCGQALALPLEPAPRRISRRTAIGKGMAITAGAVLLPLGGLAAFAVYEKVNDRLLFNLNSIDINAAAWSPDSTRLASAGLTGAQIWDISTGKRLLKAATHESLDDIVWSADGRRLLTLQQ